MNNLYIIKGITTKPDRVRNIVIGDVDTQYVIAKSEEAALAKGSLSNATISLGKKLNKYWN